MFKAEHLKEATELATNFRVLKEQLEQLDKESTLTVSFGTRTVHIKESDPKFSEMKGHMRVFLELRIANCKRRAAQLDFLLEPIVYEKVQTKSDVIKAYADKHGLAIVDVPLSSPWADEAAQLFTKS